MDLISVIVPIYNVEKYLNKCIESIVSQTYANLEILLVDDGSTDGSPAICDSWAEKDSRIKVIHKPNGGGGEARNVGFDAASGDIISLIDSDDYPSPTMFEHLMSLMSEDVDIAECEIVNTYTDEAEFSSATKTVTANTEEALRYNIGDKIFRQTPPNKLYRKSAVDGVYFPVGKLIDDEFWTYKVFAKARYCVHSDAKLYAYRQREESAMHISFSLKRLQAVEAKLERLTYIEKEHPELTHYAARNLWGTCMYLMQMSMKYLSEEDCKRASEYITDKIRNIMAKVDIGQLPMKSKVWFLMSKCSFILTCKLRNILNYGL